MTENAAPPPGSIPGVHITDVVSIKIGDDGTTAMVVFRITENGGIDFAMTLPVAGLGTLLKFVADLRNMATARNLDPGMVLAHQPKTFSVGNTPMQRGVVFIILDEKTPDEVSIRLLDGDALQLAQMVERDVLSRMTPAERAAAMRAQKPLLLPNQPKLIIPGGR